jgi:hypothetical protein
MKDSLQPMQAAGAIVFCSPVGDKPRTARNQIGSCRTGWYVQQSKQASFMSIRGSWFRWRVGMSCLH